MKIQNKTLTDILPSSQEIENLFDQLWPICRSIVGPGFQQSLSLLQKVIPLEVFKVPSGKQVFDWTVPKEWSIEDAYIENSEKVKIVDFKKNNLHVVSHSSPVDQVLSLEELLPRLHSIPDMPDAIPYRTTYYDNNWGFCISDKVKKTLKPGNYKVVIKSRLSDGNLWYGQKNLPSTSKESTKEILISSYLCHPSMANNELSGPLVTAFLYRALSNLPHRKFNYRFVIVPETIGSICFLNDFGSTLKEKCISGLVVTCCGDSAPFQYKSSRRGNAPVDLIAKNILSYDKTLPGQTKFHDFFPTGSDERQYCSPGFNLPVGSLTRSMYGFYKEYHTSLDNKSFISFASMVQTIEFYLKILLGIENNSYYLNLNPMCEPMLGKRDLYGKLGASTSISDDMKNILYILNYSDGDHDLLDIANKAQTPISSLVPLVELLIENKLLKKQDPSYKDSV